jgi:membrane fusion protein, type I secretion system
MAHQVAYAHEWYGEIPRSARVPTLFGYFLLVVAVCGFGYWSSTALIAGAVLAPGSFVATGENKIIQHLEGGVIKDIRVSEGDVVEKGQVLVDLDERAPQAELRRLILREAQAMASEARLTAEMNERDLLVYPPQLMAMSNDPDIKEILAQERQALTARRNALKAQIATLGQGIDALDERVKGGRVQLASVQHQLELVEEELKGKNYLLERGLIRKPEVLTLQRAQANLQGEIGRLNGEVGDARERIARIQEQIVSVRNDAVKSVSDQMQDVMGELKDVRERIRSAKAVLERVSITAPVKGIVVKLQYHTPGGVIEPGKPIMELLPLGQDLIIQAHVKPRDIDVVQKGQHAMVRLTALNRRITPMINGEVIYVSADSLVSESRQDAGASDVYVARIKLNTLEASQVPDFKPTPGMPVEVYIKTADRTFLEYLTKPIRDTMSRAFRES